MSRLTVDNTRKITAPLPSQQSIHLTQFYQGGRYEVRKILDFFKSEGKLSKETALEIIKRACRILSSLSLMQRWNPICCKSQE